MINDINPLLMSKCYLVLLTLQMYAGALLFIISLVNLINMLKIHTELRFNPVVFQFRLVKFDIDSW